MLEFFFGLITESIERYDQVDSQYEDLNSNLVKFWDRLKGDGKILRVYTTNYDNLWPQLLGESRGIFNGYDCMEFMDSCEPNMSKILRDRDNDIHYNLHGSIYFRFQNLSEEDQIGKFLYCPQRAMEAVSSTSSEMVNPSEAIFVSNIVTGFNKIQRAYLEPLKAFFHSLAEDCLVADEVILAGYSLSDPHINRNLAYAFRKSSPAKLTVVSYGTLEEFLNGREYSEIQKLVTSQHEFYSFKVLDSSDSSNIHVAGNALYLQGLQSYIAMMARD